jgi:hypothetical protein
MPNTWSDIARRNLSAVLRDIAFKVAPVDPSVPPWAVYGDDEELEPAQRP